MSVPKILPLAITPGLHAVTIEPSKEYLLKKEGLLESASLVFSVGDEDEEEAAMVVARQIKALETEVEKSREAVKKPILVIGREIDAKAKEFVKELAGERERIEGLVGSYLRERREKLMRAQEEERKALAAQQEAEAARQAEVEALAEALGVEAPEPVPAPVMVPVALATPTPTVSGGAFRSTLDFEVTDIKALYAAFPWLVKMEVNRQSMIAYLNGGACPNPETPGSIPGVTVFRKDKFSARAANPTKTIQEPNPFD